MILFVYVLAFLKNVIYGLSVFFTGSLVSSTDVLDVLALRFLLSWFVFEILKQTKILISRKQPQRLYAIVFEFHFIINDFYFPFVDSIYIEILCAHTHT